MHEPAGSGAASMGIYERGGGEGSRMVVGLPLAFDAERREVGLRRRQLSTAPVSGAAMWSAQAWRRSWRLAWAYDRPAAEAACRSHSMPSGERSGCEGAS
jgi:hypothetical protein